MEQHLDVEGAAEAGIEIIWRGLQSSTEGDSTLEQLLVFPAA